MPPVWYLCFSSFSSWLLIMNASFNFLIYCSVGTGFKEVFATLTGCSSKCSCISGGGGSGSSNGSNPHSTSPRNSCGHENNNNNHGQQQQMSLTVAVRKDSTSLRLQPVAESVPLTVNGGDVSAAAVVETVIVANGEHHV